MARLHRLGAFLFGGSCYLCRGPIERARRAESLCAACDADLPRDYGPHCPVCADPSPSAAVCGRCLSAPPRFDATVAAMAYRFPGDVLIQALKFRGELALAPVLGALLAERIGTRLDVDLATVMPLSAGRLRERGYNQSLEIARHAVPERLAFDARLCERTRETSAQSDLTLEARRRNVRGAFRCDRPLAGLRVAVIDDVMSSGATLDALARELKRAGAERIVNWVVARALPDGAVVSDAASALRAVDTTAG